MEELFWRFLPLVVAVTFVLVILWNAERYYELDTATKAEEEYIEELKRSIKALEAPDPMSQSENQPTI